MAEDFNEMGYVALALLIDTEKIPDSKFVGRSSNVIHRVTSCINGTNDRGYSHPVNYACQGKLHDADSYSKVL